MMKYENIDIIAALGVVVENNTKNYKSDFMHDVKMFKAAASQPDGENNRFLWLSRPSGTECFTERSAYIRESYSHIAWLYHAKQENESFIAYAVEVTGLDGNNVMGNLYELDYRQHAAELQKSSLPCNIVAMVFKDGTQKQLSYPEYEKQRVRLCNQHGWIRQMELEPESGRDLKAALDSARAGRGEMANAAASKARVPEKPGIKQQLSASRKQRERQRPAVPVPAKKNTLIAMEV
jgi:hypothetical protein